MQIFGGKFSSTERAPIQPDTVTSDYWRSLHLDIQVCFSSFLPLLPTHALIFKPFVQPDSVHTIQDALTYPQPMQVGQPSSSEASQQVLFEALPPVLVLHLKRFFYDAIEDSIVKISKPLKFTPELEIPPGKIFPIPFSPCQPRLRIPRVQNSWHPSLENRCTTSCMECFTTKASPQAVRTIRSMCFTRTETAVMWNLGYTLTMKL